MAVRHVALEPFLDTHKHAHTHTHTHTQIRQGEGSEACFSSVKRIFMTEMIFLSFLTAGKAPPALDVGVSIVVQPSPGMDLLGRFILKGGERVWRTGALPLLTIIDHCK